MLCCTQAIDHRNGSILKVIICAIERVISEKFSFVIDDIAKPAGNRPVIVPKIHNSRAVIRNQFDVVRGRVRLIENVGKVCLQKKAGQRVPRHAF